MEDWVAIVTMNFGLMHPSRLSHYTLCAHIFVSHVSLLLMSALQIKCITLRARFHHISSLLGNFKTSQTVLCFRVRQIRWNRISVHGQKPTPLQLS